MYLQERKKAELFERKFIEERDKRIELESHKLTELDIKYIKSLIQFDETINGLKHGRWGLYSEENTEFLDYTTELKSKLSKLVSS